MADKRREDAPEIFGDESETRGGIDIPVPEDAPARGRSRRGRKRTAPPAAEPDLLPESAAPAGTVYTLGPQNEFGDVENVSFEEASDNSAETSAPKEGDALDISDIPNAVPAPDAPKPAGNSRKRKKRRAAQARNTDGVSAKASVSAEDTASDSVSSSQEPHSAAEPTDQPSQDMTPQEAAAASDPSAADQPAKAEEASAAAVGGSPTAARSKRRGKRRTAPPKPAGDMDAPAEIGDAPEAAPADAVPSPDAEPASSVPAKNPKKKSRRPADKTADAPADTTENVPAEETEDTAAEAPEKPKRTPKPKAPAAALLLRGALTENPLLFGLVGVFPAVAAASTGSTALAAGICALAALLVTNLAASLIGGRLPRRLRAALMLLLAACVSSGEQLALAALLPDTADALGVFIPLVAVCGLTLSREDFAAERHPVSALLDAAACGVGFTAALTLFGVIREVLGSRTLFGLKLPLPPVLAFSAPMGGLLLLGLLSGAARYVRTKRRASKRGSKEAEL